MAVFDGAATGEQVVEAFASQVKGRTFVITGAGKPSIGSQIATLLASASPAHILIASRTASKVDAALDDIKQIDPSIKTTFVQVDLSDHDSVRHAAKEILAAAPKIDVLINSAGVMALKEYTLDKQGIELQLSSNHVGHFLLTNLLMPALLAAGADNGARVVNLTSSGYLISPFRFDDWNYSAGATYDPWTGYGQSKTANVLFAFGLTKRLQHRGVTSTATHPGYNHETRLGSHLTGEDYGAISPTMKRNTGKEFVFEEPRFKSFSQITATTLVAALDPDIPARSPAFLQNSRVMEPEAHARDAESVDKLWKLSEELVGQEFRY
ncbi:short-chain dehydrogenase [Podospora appendiculata]|uniref:Short-chain dehydrogenase n=1 Tax=Podospora appendiculata TaxID=314037 RepID=A0AAE0XCU1_9PEZI|nr:short-chain dehydrogenase [Podospora appendiculata]